MEVYALSGPSGTGKSDSALLFAHEHQIPAIIDDGLLIYHGQRVAGRSAKYEQNTITAVKRAVFLHEEHRQEVLQALKRLSIDKILILGTSKKMVRKIAKRLELGKIDHYIDIYDIRTPSEIKMALFVRQTKGEHVIPIPSVQIEQNLFKRLMAKGSKVFSLQRKVIGETTIVKPDFQMGSISIFPGVLKKIIIHRLKSFPEIISYRQMQINVEQSLPTVSLQLHLEMTLKDQAFQLIKALQQQINEDFQQHLNIDLYSVNIDLAKVSLKD